MRIAFTVPGQPVPAPRPRVVSGGRGVIRNPRYEAYKEEIAYTYLQGRHPRTPYLGPVGVKAIFWMKDRRRVDVDNLAKTILDALNQVAYQDDSQVILLVVRKGYDARNPRLQVRLAFMEVADA